MGVSSSENKFQRVKTVPFLDRHSASVGFVNAKLEVGWQILASKGVGVDHVVVLPAPPMPVYQLPQDARSGHANN